MAAVASLAFKTFHVIGDSHALAFKGKAIAVPQYGLAVSASVAYVRGLTADTLITQGQIHPELAQYLLRVGLIGQDGQSIAVTKDTKLILEQYATGSGFERPVILLHAGEVFVRKYLATIHAQPHIDLAPVEAKFREIINKYMADARGLRDYFKCTLFIHEVPPPTADDLRFKKINNFLCSKELRATIYALYNKILREAAQANGLPLCASHDYMNQGGLLAEEYEFDGVHANPKYAAISLNRIMDIWLNSRTADQTQRYGAWQNQVSSPTNTPREKLTISEIFTPFTPEQLSAIKQEVGPFDVAACPQPPLDWAHVPPTPNYPKFNSKITYANLNARGLKILHDALLSGPQYAALKAQLGADFSIVNTRVVKSDIHTDDGSGPQFFHYDGCPPGIYRGLIYLSDVDDNAGPFAYMPAEGSTPTLVTGDAGSMVLFDANAIKHRATPPRITSRLAIDLVLLLHPESCARIAHSRSKCTWPIDPYMFSLTEHVYPPNPSKRWFHPTLLAPPSTSTAVKTLTPEQMALSK